MTMFSSFFLFLKDNDVQFGNVLHLASPREPNESFNSIFILQKISKKMNA